MAHHITKTISNNAYWQINKHLHKQLGLRTTLLLQHFIDLQTKVFHGNEFFQSYKQIEKELILTEYHIKDSIKKLKEAGIITVEKKGMPAKNHYFVLIDKVEELLSLDLEKSPNKTEIPQSVKISPTSETNIILQDSGKSTDKSSSEHLTYKRNNKKEIKIKEIIKKNTSSSATQGELNILDKLLDGVVQLQNEKLYKDSWWEINDYGGIDKVFSKLNKDTSQQNQYMDRINNAHTIYNMNKL